MSLILTGATILDGVANHPIKGHSIWIEADRIRAIGRRDGLGAPASATTMDVSGKYVIPGLMDANVHLLEDVRMENLVRYEERYEDLIEEAAQVALKSGLTTVFDTWGPRKALMNVRDKINAGEMVGSRIFCAGNIIGLDGPLSPDFFANTLQVASGQLVQRINSLWVENSGPDLTWMTPDQVVEEVRSYIKKGIDFVKYAANEHRGAEPNSFILFSPLVQTKIVEEAHRAARTAQAHTSSVEGLRLAIEAGCDLIQHCNVTGPVLIPQSTLDLLVDRNTGAVVFPFTQKRLDTIMGKAEPIVRRYFSTVDENCRNVMRAGATLLLGTDAGIFAPDLKTDPVLRNSWVADGQDNLAELGEGHFHWLSAMEEKGLDAMDALKAATRNIAVAYGKDADLGTLEAGKIADLVILNEDPLRSARSYRNIFSVIKNGAVVDRAALPIRKILTDRKECSPESVSSYGRYAVSRYPSCC